MDYNVSVFKAILKTIHQFAVYVIKNVSDVKIRALTAYNVILHCLENYRIIIAFAWVEDIILMIYVRVVLQNV